MGNIPRPLPGGWGVPRSGAGDGVGPIFAAVGLNFTAKFNPGAPTYQLTRSSCNSRASHPWAGMF